MTKQISSERLMTEDDSNESDVVFCACSSFEASDRYGRVSSKFIGIIFIFLPS